jgi:hypothetical protein
MFLSLIDAQARKSAVASSRALCEEVVGFGALALVAPEAGEAGGGAELPHFGALVPSHREGDLKTAFGRGLIADDEKHLTAQSAQLGLVEITHDEMSKRNNINQRFAIA